MAHAREQAASSGAIARALGRLDPYSFFVVPGDAWHADFAVVGTTGAFLVRTCRLTGVARVDGRRPVVGSQAVPDLRKLKAGARRFASKLGATATHADVVPVVCLTDAIAGAPVDGGGVRFVKVEDLARDISGRPAVQSHTRAQSAARSLGMSVAGDRGRHFAVRN